MANDLQRCAASAIEPSELAVLSDDELMAVAGGDGVISSPVIGGQ